MFPPTVDPRIIAQRSVFTLHGSRQDPIDKCCEGHSEGKIYFIRKFIFKGIKQEVLRELCCFGISRQSIFPDLEGLGLELREIYHLSFLTLALRRMLIPLRFAYTFQTGRSRRCFAQFQSVIDKF